MNWLAHIFLSEQHIEYQLGNLLTDPLKGKAWEGASDRVLYGIEMHKRIDAFTDAHPIVSQSKKRLTEDGPLKGVVLDILYDHFLSLHWDLFCTVPREVFLHDFRFEAMHAIQDYPRKAQNVISRVVGTKQLSSYIHMKGVEDAFTRIDARLSERLRAKDTTTRYLPLIEKEKAYLEEAFLVFFPELMAMVKETCYSNNEPHWKIPK